MPGILSTHVLDTAHGRPASGMAVSLWHRESDDIWTCLVRTTTNADGRTDDPLLVADILPAGTFEIRFAVGRYFGEQAAFLEEVPVRFTVTDQRAKYHVPLLVTPWSYSTYRGS